MRRATTILLFILALLFSNTLFGIENEPDGLRGIKWETDLSGLPAMSLGIDENNKQFYTRTNDTLSMGSATLKLILYIAYKHKFQGVVITYEGYNNYKEIKEFLIHTYGKSYDPKKEFVEHHWRGNDVEIALNYKKIPDKGNIFYRYVPLHLQQYRDEKKAKEIIR